MAQHLALKVTELIRIHLKDKEYGQSHVEGLNRPNLEVMYITSAHMPQARNLSRGHTHQ